MTRSRDPFELIAELTWPIARVMECFEALVLHTDLPRHEVTLPAKPVVANVASITKWVRSSARVLGLDVTPVAVHGHELEAFFARGAPALLEFGPPATARVLVLARTRGRSCDVVTSLGDVVTVPSAQLDTMVVELESMTGESPEDRIREAFAGRPRLEGKLLGLMQEERRARMKAGSGYLLTLNSTRSALNYGRSTGAFRHLAVIVGAVIATYACTFGAWFWLSDVALVGRIDTGRITAWGVLVMAGVPLELAIAWAAGSLALRLGVFLRRRLLEGTFRTSLETIREQGIGTTVTLVNEPEVLEEAVLGQGTLSFAVGLDAAAAWGAIAFGDHALELGVLFALIWCVALWTVRRVFLRTELVAKLRGNLTAELVDRLVGHRTRAVQQRREKWHEGEDEPLASYAAESRRFDGSRSWLRALPRLWLLLGATSVLVHFALDGGQGTIPLIGLVGVVLGQQAFTSFASLLPAIALTRASYRRLQPLLRAGYAEESKPIDAMVDTTAYDPTDPIIQALDVQFQHRVGGRRILKEVNLTLYHGDRVLLQGPSGGGKSTLASVITGLRSPTSGVLLVRGFDQHTLDEASWRRIVATAPQFHENVIFSKTLAFNLLASRRWPVTGSDLLEAEQLCRELGLGPLLDRMPSGLNQLVGSTGWQLSHGERSRVYIARALLQNAALIVLDESFGALDPETLSETVACVIRRASSLLVIAHS